MKKITITIDEAIIIEKLLLEIGTIQPQEVIDLEKKIRKALGRDNPRRVSCGYEGCEC